MPEISAIIILFRLKRNHVAYYDINNNSIFSAPWVFITMFSSFHIDYKEEKKKKKKKNKPLFRKKYNKKQSISKHIQRLPVNLQQAEFYFGTQ